MNERLRELAHDIAEEFCGGSDAIKECILGKLLAALASQEPPATRETVLRQTLERCRAWNKRVGNWSSEMERQVDVALAADESTPTVGPRETRDAKL
jgi:hypothetical protein